MKNEQSEVAVVGQAIGGLTLTDYLSRECVPVVGLDSGSPKASSLTNHKWKHSGLLYSREDLAAKMWRAYVGMDPLEREFLLKGRADFLAHDVATLLERAAMWRHWGIPFHRLPAFQRDERSPHRPRLGCPDAVGGFRTFDSVIDFPALLPALKARAEVHGARIVHGATVQHLLRDGDAITGMLYEIEGRTVCLHSPQCVVAAGAWSLELLRSIGVDLPVRRWKSHILTYPDGELVERILAWLDPARLTIVPYAGKTLFADTRRRPADDGDDRTPVAEDVDALKADIAACFPGLRSEVVRRLHAHACIKTEAVGTTQSNPDMVVFDESCHGVRGLRVLFPGKASLAFVLARLVGQAILAEVGPQPQEVSVRVAAEHVVGDPPSLGAGSAAH